MASTTDDQIAYIMQPGGFAPPYGQYDGNGNGNTTSPTPSDPLPVEEPIHAPPKRKEPSDPSTGGRKATKKAKKVGPRADSKASLTTSADGDKDGGEGSANKPKRVRTGCLTCRERHLKCDEGMPCCNNCKKSNRTCKRGVRLNFIDTWVDAPPTVVSLYGTQEWKVDFLDESREIASEYQGGVQQYRGLDLAERAGKMGLVDQEQEMVLSRQLERSGGYEYGAAAVAVSVPFQQPLPSMHSMLPETYPDLGLQQQQQQQQQQQLPEVENIYDPQMQMKPDSGSYQMPPPPQSGSTGSAHFSSSIVNSAGGGGNASITSYNTAPSHAQVQDPDPEAKSEYLDNQDETLFMQVFVEEVGLWMDSMDPLKHFSRLLPFHSLGEPMLLNAFLACGARHLTLVNPIYTEEKALHYYDTATHLLLKNLQNPHRDTVICATTAVILNVYEIMSERALQRMNHIAGARALIKECGWNARSRGIGSACFWLNVGLEVLSCLHFNWQVAWDPDDWELEVEGMFEREVQNGREEVWTQRLLYVVGKICNFRATAPRTPSTNNKHTPDSHQQRRFEEWTRLKGMVEAWDQGCPRTMQPMAYLQPWQTSSKSLFPEVWLVKRTTIVARLFWHMAQLLLGQCHPYWGREEEVMAEGIRRHGRMICGIVAHVKDRGVASVALRSLAHAAEVLTDRAEQEEVLSIFDKINKETGWRIGFVYIELKKKWGWNEEPSPQQIAQTHTAVRQQQKEAQERQLQEQQKQQQQQQGYPQQQQQQGFQMQMQPPPPPQPAAPAPAAMKKPPSGIQNPMYAKADFNLPQHPYQNFYVAPMQPSQGLQQQQQQGFGSQVPLQGGQQHQGQGGGGLYYNNFG